VTQSGAPNCLEPALGHFNTQAFRVMDYAIARARTYGIKLIPEFQGDTRAEHAASTADHLLELARRRRLLDRPHRPRRLREPHRPHRQQLHRHPYKDDPPMMINSGCGLGLNGRRAIERCEGNLSQP